MRAVWDARFNPVLTVVVTVIYHFSRVELLGLLFIRAPVSALVVREEKRRALGAHIRAYSHVVRRVIRVVQRVFCRAFGQTHVICPLSAKKLAGAA